MPEGLQRQRADVDLWIHAGWRWIAPGRVELPLRSLERARANRYTTGPPAGDAVYGPAPDRRGRASLANICSPAARTIRAYRNSASAPAQMRRAGRAGQARSRRTARSRASRPSSRWSPDIKLRRDNCRRSSVTGNAVAGGARSAAGWSRSTTARSVRTQDEGRARGRARRTRSTQAGCMLYWAEGSKVAQHASCSRTATPTMVRLFRRFLDDSLDVRPGPDPCPGQRLHEQRPDGRGRSSGTGSICSSFRSRPSRGRSSTTSRRRAAVSDRRSSPYGVCTLRVSRPSRAAHLRSNPGVRRLRRARWLDGTPRAERRALSPAGARAGPSGRGGGFRPGRRRRSDRRRGRRR